MPFHDLIRRCFCAGIIMLHSFPLQAQDWQWEWGNPHGESFPAMVGIEDIGTDHVNHIRVIFQYTDSVHVGDTVFRHETGFQTTNSAIVFYDEDGRFLRAIDLFTTQGGNIWHPRSISDASGNIYIATEFQVQATLMDTVINHGPGPWPQIPDILLAKLNPEMEIEWIHLIWGTTQSVLNGLVVGSDQQIYLSTHHYGNGSQMEEVNFFGADSASFERSIQCVLKIDPDGNLVWRREIRSDNISSPARCFLSGEDEILYLLTDAYSDLYIGSDTLIKPPVFPSNYTVPAVLKFSREGNFLDGLMVSNGLSLYELKAGPPGELYFAGFVLDTAYLAGDTLVRDPDSVYSIIGKADAGFNITWYQPVISPSSQTSPYFRLAHHEGNLYFASTVFRSFTLAGQLFNVGSIRKAMVGGLLPNGELDHYMFGQASMEMQASLLTFDNCRNLLLGGSFRGTGYFGGDTIYSYYPGPYVGLIKTHAPLDPIPGNDTAVCNELILHALPGLAGYSWNNGISSADSLQVTETGLYTVTVHTDHFCWATDSVYVSVTHPPDHWLANDTTIFMKDSLVLRLNSPFDHCLWSTGDTVAEITVAGKKLGTGTHPFSVTVSTGACTTSDTLLVTVFANPGTGEWIDEELHYYPNPCSDQLTIRIDGGNTEVSVSDPEGRVLLTRKFSAAQAGYRQISVKDLPDGIYFLRLVSGSKVLTGKLIRQ